MSAPRLPSSFSISFNSGIIGGGGPAGFVDDAELWPNRKLDLREDC